MTLPEWISGPDVPWSIGVGAPAATPVLLADMALVWMVKGVEDVEKFSQDLRHVHFVLIRVYESSFR